MNELREQIEEELGAEPPLPYADLVDGALRQGRRRVLTRRLGVGAVSLALVLIVAGVAWLAPRDGFFAQPAPADTPRPSPVATLPAGAATIAYEVARRLPAGTRLTTAYRYENDPAGAAVYLDHGTGAGLLQLAVDAYPRTPDTCRDTTKRSVTCRTEADGSLTVIANNSDDCLEATVVEKYRPDGVHVRAYLATCLMWDGIRNPPAASPLSVDDAVRLASDPAWGVEMDERLVTDAAARYPTLPMWVAP